MVKWRIAHLGLGETVCDEVHVEASGVIQARTYVKRDSPAGPAMDILTTKFFAPGGWLRAEQFEEKQS